MTTFSPFYLLYLREVRIPIDLVMESVGEAVPADWNDHVTEMRKRIEQAFQQFETNSVKRFRGLNRPTMAVSKSYSLKLTIWCGSFAQKTAEVAIVNLGALAYREDYQLRQLRNSTGRWPSSSGGTRRSVTTL